MEKSPDLVIQKGNICFIPTNQKPNILARLGS